MTQLPPYPGMPTPPAPAWVFPLFETTLYLLFLLCFWYACKKGAKDLGYLLGGLCFGLLLEYMEVAMYSYSYGRFWVMLGRYPINVPLCIGMGWGIIMYSSRLFTDRLGLTLWACAALDTLLAINIDLSMDTVACRLHMWNWNWGDPSINPLTADWFGIPWGNFVGWQTVVFCYSAFSRMFERTKMAPAFIAALALLCSLAVLYGTEEIFPLFSKIGITSFNRFIGLCVVFILLVAVNWRKRIAGSASMPALTWLAPGCFHFYFFAMLWIGGFYTGQLWMTIAASINFVIGMLLHLLPVGDRNSGSGNKVGSNAHRILVR